MSTTKQSRYLLALPAALMLAAGGMAADVHASSDRNTDIEEIRAEMNEAADAMKEYSADRRDEAVAKVESILERADARLDALGKRVESGTSNMTDAARAKARDTLRALRVQRNRVAEWYGGIKHGSADAWNQVKGGFLSAYESIAASLDEAESEY